jgi:7-cyano-7-deazaguanine synthase
LQLLLLSGGIESSALAAWLRPPLVLSIDYGQVPANGELWAASQVCATLGLQHHTLAVDSSAVGSGLLAGRGQAEHAPVAEWWPYRNQLLVTLAGAWGISRGASEIVVGSIAGDGRHVDGTAAFYEQMDAIMALQEGGLRVTAPAIAMSSVELIAASGVSDAVLGWTHSCHVANVACGACPGCVKRHDVLRDAGRLLCS